MKMKTKKQIQQKRDQLQEDWDDYHDNDNFTEDPHIIEAKINVLDWVLHD